jgi:hypothetical protein
MSPIPQPAPAPTSVPHPKLQPSSTTDFLLAKAMPSVKNLGFTGEYEKQADGIRWQVLFIFQHGQNASA